MPSQAHVVFLNIAGTGHINPTLPVVAELVDRGCKVTYFVEATQRAVVEAAGAAWRPFRYEHDAELSGIPHQLDDFGVASLVPRGTPKEEYASFPDCLLYWAERGLPGLIEDLRSLAPAPLAVVYDPFLAAGRVAARVMGIPAICMLTMPGPGVLTVPEAATAAQEAKPWVEKPRRAIAEKYGIDVLEDGMIMEHYSPVENLATTVGELFAAPCTKRQVERFGRFPFTCVGALMNPKVKRISNANVHKAPGQGSGVSAPLPMESIREAQQAGTKILFISLGTVATSDAFWQHPFGPFALNNEAPGKAEAEGRAPLSEWTGKEFCQHVWRACFDAFGDDEGYLVIMSLGPKEDALEGLPPTPANFLVRDAVPQLEVLPACDAFVTHGGANSMHEALGLGVPLVVVPIFGDQPPNADTVARSGAGLSLRNPLSTVSAATLSFAVAEAAASGDGGAPNRYRKAAKVMEGKLKAAGGVQAAADTILRHTSNVASKWGGR